MEKINEVESREEFGSPQSLVDETDIKKTTIKERISFYSKMLEKEKQDELMSKVTKQLKEFTTKNITVGNEIKKPLKIDVDHFREDENDGFASSELDSCHEMV